MFNVYVSKINKSVANYAIVKRKVEKHLDILLETLLRNTPSIIKRFKRKYIKYKYSSLQSLVELFYFKELLSWDELVKYTTILEEQKKMLTISKIANSYGKVSIPISILSQQDRHLINKYSTEIIC